MTDYIGSIAHRRLEMGKSSLWARVGRDKKKGRNRRTERKREGGRGEGEQGRGEERKEMWKEGRVGTENSLGL